MSKGTLSALKGEINTEMRHGNSTVSNLKGLEGSVVNAMDDRVGHTARDSITSIERSLSYSVDKGYKGANDAVSAMERGYNQIGNLASQGDAIVKQGRSIVKELGQA